MEPTTKKQLSIIGIFFAVFGLVLIGGVIYSAIIFSRGFVTKPEDTNTTPSESTSGASLPVRLALF